MPRAIRDKFRKVARRQERYRLRKKRQGKCINDGKDLSAHSLVLCAACLKRHRARVQKWRASFKKLIEPVRSNGNEMDPLDRSFESIN